MYCAIALNLQLQMCRVQGKLEVLLGFRASGFGLEFELQDLKIS